jgi:hypothetical protein
MEYKYEFLASHIPQQDGIVENKKKRTLQEFVRIMLHEYSLTKHLWAETINTICYIINRVSIRPILNKTPYELWKSYKSNIFYFRLFRSN